MANETRLQQVEARKAALKQDPFLPTSSSGLEWASAHRKSLLAASLALFAVIVVAVIAVVIFSRRSDAAAAGFGRAMQTYESPLVTPGEPQEPGVTVYNSASERAKAANAQFLAVANQYGLTRDGKNALYFAGITSMEAGQTASAEADLKKVAGFWNKELAALGKFALADLYHGTGRDQQAIELYKQLAAKPTDAVPAGLAQITLAGLYTDEGKPEQARQIYAQLKDKDKDAKGLEGPTGAIAAQKLNPAPAGGPVPQL